MRPLPGRCQHRDYIKRKLDTQVPAEWQASKKAGAEPFPADWILAGSPPSRSSSPPSSPPDPLGDLPSYSFMALWLLVLDVFPFCPEDPFFGRRTCLCFESPIFDFQDHSGFKLLSAFSTTKTSACSRGSLRTWLSSQYRHQCGFAGTHCAGWER